jgi:gliding motility-associated-like protein
VPRISTQSIQINKGIALVLLVLGLLAPQRLDAAHAMGGEVYYEYLGGGDFQISLIFYRECFNSNVEPSGWQNGGTNLDPTIMLGVFEGGTEYNIFTVPLTVSSIEPLETELENPCGILPPDLCMQRLEYSIIINLPPSSIGYDIVFQRCCRNPGIANIPNPGDIGITLSTQIPPNVSDSNPNSSPQFGTYPPEAICTNFDFFLDQSATDIDGDSLAYSFCTPLNGGSTTDPSPTPLPASSFSNIPWGGGYSALDPIPSSPPFDIDPITGQVTGFPTTPGAYVIGICVSEFRDGELLSTVMRDFQFNVVMCDPTIISAAQPQTTDQLCIGETLEFTENSIGAQDLLWDFGVPGTNTDISTLSNPEFTFPDTGVYTVMLIANPSWPCADTSSQVFYVYEPILPEISVSDFQCSENLEYFAFEGIGAFTEATNLIWIFEGGSPEAANIVNPSWIEFDNAESWEATLTASHYGCNASTTFTWDAPPDPLANIADQSSFCQGFTFDFENLSQNAESWVWDFGIAGNSDVSWDESPTFTYPGDGIYTVQVIAQAPYTCSDTAWATVEIFPAIDPAFEAPDPECFSTNNFSLIPLVENEEGTTYSWDFGGSTESANINGPSVQNLVYSEPGTYTVEVTALANGCEVTASEEITVISDPTIQFQGGPLTGCPPHLVSFTNLSMTETATTYLWHFGDGQTSPAANASHVYEFSGNFSVTLEMNAGGYCAQELILTQNNMIGIQDVPQAGFDITPNQVDILTPIVTYESLASEGAECFYSFGDGGSSSDCSGQYTYSDGGLFNVTQTVVNAAGCTSTATGQVAVNGSVFYAPNAFTPNNDGLNDVWIPVALGVTEYEMKIFNRWGELIWKTRDPAEPWLGQVHDGDHYAPDGLYFWEAWIEDQIHYPTTYSGHLQLIR